MFLSVPVSLSEKNGTLRTGNKSELANVTENIDCAEIIQLHATPSFLITDGQALVVALGKPDAASTLGGDLTGTNVKTLLKAGSEYHRIDVVFDRHRVEKFKDTTRPRRS